MSKDKDLRDIFEKAGYKLVFKHYRHYPLLQAQQDIVAFAQDRVQDCNDWELVKAVKKLVATHADTLADLEASVVDGLVISKYSKHFKPFVPGHKGGATAVCVINKDGSIAKYAVAYCSSQDNFEYAEGRKQALKEALGGLIWH